MRHRSAFPFYLMILICGLQIGKAEPPLRIETGKCYFFMRDISHRDLQAFLPDGRYFVIARGRASVFVSDSGRWVSDDSGLVKYSMKKKHDIEFQGLKISGTLFGEDLLFNALHERLRSFLAEKSETAFSREEIMSIWKTTIFDTINVNGIEVADTTTSVPRSDLAILLDKIENSIKDTTANRFRFYLLGSHEQLGLAEEVWWGDETERIAFAYWEISRQEFIEQMNTRRPRIIDLQAKTAATRRTELPEIEKLLQICQ